MVLLCRRAAWLRHDASPGAGDDAAVLSAEFTAGCAQMPQPPTMASTPSTPQATILGYLDIKDSSGHFGCPLLDGRVAFVRSR